MEDLCIGGKRYEVQLVKRIARDTFLMGETDFVEQTIKVHDSLKADRKREVLLHEIVHCIFEDSGDTVSNNDERLVSTIASGLNQVLSHNPWLVLLFISRGLNDEE